MKKISLLAIPLAALAILPGCIQDVNQSPELTGIGDINCLVNTTVDLLDGVAALDTEDGDITPDIDITIIPQTEVNGGYAVFREAGTYELIYEVEDSQGKTFRTTAYAEVSDRDVFMDSATTNGFSLATGGHVKVEREGLNGSEYAFIAEGGEIAEDVRLTRQYTLENGSEYTFTYNCTSNLAGRIKAAVDGEAVADLNLVEGQNTLTFTYTHEGDTQTSNCNVELWLGGLEGRLEFSLSGAQAGHEMADNEYVAIEDFNFDGHIEPRFDGPTGTTAVVDGGVELNITETPYSSGSDMWRGGVFINTGLAITAGTTYIISFDTVAANDAPYGVNIQSKQWGPDEVITGVTPVSGQRTTVEVTPSVNGTLWLYVQSGNSVNTITLSNLSVSVREGGYQTEDFTITPFTTGHYEGAAGTMTCEYGTVTYVPTAFGNDWGNNEIDSPTFYLSGAAENFVITFTASSTKNISCVFAASVYGAWDTFAWRNFTIAEGTNTYSITCDNKALDGNYRFIWQFGNAANATAAGAEIKISDIKICYKSELE